MSRSGGAPATRPPSALAKRTQRGLDFATSHARVKMGANLGAWSPPVEEGVLERSARRSARISG